MDFIFIPLAFVILILIVLYIIFGPWFRERKISNGIRNQDSLSQDYLFKVNYTKSDFLQKTNISNSYDILEYTFDNNTMIITFSKYSAHISYTVFIKEFDNGCYVKLKKNATISYRSNIPFYINEFMIKKFGAELLPYEEYKDIVI